MRSYLIVNARKRVISIIIIGVTIVCCVLLYRSEMVHNSGKKGQKQCEYVLMDEGVMHNRSVVSVERVCAQGTKESRGVGCDENVTNVKDVVEFSEDHDLVANGCDIVLLDEELCQMVDRLVDGGGDTAQIEIGIKRKCIVVSGRHSIRPLSLLPEVLGKVVNELVDDMIEYDAEKWVSRYELSQRLWEQLMGYNPSWFKGSDNPVENVSWRECMQLCEHLNKSEYVKSLSIVFELPFCGDWKAVNSKNLVGGACNNSWSSNNSGFRTHAVGSLDAGAIGVFDCEGNIWEWSACNPDIDHGLKYMGAHARGGGWESTCSPQFFLVANPDCGFSFYWS